MIPLSPTRESSFFDDPPSYARSTDSGSSIPSPQYSPSPRASELIIRSGSEATCLSLDNYAYRSKHITVNLGPKIWGTSIPIYGNNASIDGTLSLSGDLRGVTAMYIKAVLQGAVTNTYTERGLITGSSSVGVLETCCSFATLAPDEWSDGRPFSITFPTAVVGRRNPLPPSAIIYLPGITCAVRYRLKVKLFRKGLRRNECFKIPLLYLPRTFAKGPLLSRIPSIPSDPNQLTSGDYAQGVYSVPLRGSSKKLSIDNAPSIILTLPSTLSFASYDSIPVSLSVRPAQNAAIAKLLLSAAKIQLVKRSRTWLNGGRNASKHESLLAVAEVVDADEGQANANTVSYELCTARPAAQKSWAIDGVAEQQYYIHVSINPPPAMAAHMPTYECEQLVEITTDAFDTHEREIVELGGTPTPAIGTLGAESPYSRPEVVNMLGAFR
ncbi:hypothetical protein ACEPAH_4965 [Sanghuangporus vaninii]